MTTLGQYRGNPRDMIGALLGQTRPGRADVGEMYRPNMNRLAARDNLAALATGVETATVLYLEAGDVVTSLTFVSGATAAGTPTHQYAALRGTDGALLAQSADLLTAAWAANTPKTFTLAAPYTITASGLYLVGVMVAATTPPTLAGSSVQVGASGAVLAGDAVLAKTHGSSLTATAPATVATPTTVGTVPLVVAS